jgi:TRAP-type C4-dicarboxylate transport system permease small subunit
MIWWDRVERLLIGMLGACALAVGAFQVAGRYIDRRLAFPWGDEVVVYFIVWAIFIAASQLVRRDGHVRPDLVLRALPPQGQRWVECFNCCVAIAFCAGLVWCGYQIVSDSYALDERSITGLGFPMYLYYAALLVGGSLMLARYLIRLYRYLFRFDPATMVIAPGLDH